MIRLVSVYERLQTAMPLLYQLLLQREPSENISHRAMPSYDAHKEFVLRRPYVAWYLVTHEDRQDIGACYLTQHREIGIGILKDHRGHGFGKQAIKELMRIHGRGRYLANINPANSRSIELFRGLGFGGPIQITMEYAQ